MLYIYNSRRYRKVKQSDRGLMNFAAACNEKKSFKTSIN